MTAPLAGPRVLDLSTVIAGPSGFGQDGPYAQRAGFPTMAEAMGGLAAINGEPDGQG